MPKEAPGRRSVMAGMGAAAAGLAVGASTACAQVVQAPTASGGFEPARHALDEWLDALPGQHRVFIDSATALGGAEALVYANNLYNSQQNAYGGTASDLAMVICLRHFSTPFAYRDDVWAKYGDAFHRIMQFPDPDTGEAPTLNLMNSTDHLTLPNVANTIDSLIARGTQFAVCEAATRFFAQQIATTTDLSSDVVYEELVASAFPTSRFVSAGVMALTRAQEYGYSLLYAG